MTLTLKTAAIVLMILGIVCFFLDGLWVNSPPKAKLFSLGWGFVMLAFLLGGAP